MIEIYINTQCYVDNVVNIGNVDNFVHLGYLIYKPSTSYISRRPMPHTVLECQVFKMSNSDTCPRPTTKVRAEMTEGVVGVVFCVLFIQRGREKNLRRELI